MNQSALRLFVRSIIAEAKDKKTKEEPKKAAKKDTKKTEPKKAESKKETSKPKSSGKLVDLKKEVAYLRQMSEQLQEMGLNEGSEVTEVEFSNLQKFVNELAKVKEASANLKNTLEEEITATEARIQEEKNKIKEMMGLVPEKKEPVRVTPDNEVKADKDTPQTTEARYNTSANSKEAQHLKKGDIITSGDEVVSVSAGAKTPSGKVEVTLKTKDGKTKTSVWGKTTKVGVKKEVEEARFKKGTDIGKPGKGFEKIAKSAAKKYGSEEAGKRVAGAVLKKVLKKEGAKEFKGFEKPFVPKSEKPKTQTPAVGGRPNKKEYSDSDTNYLTDPYEKVVKK